MRVTGRQYHPSGIEEAVPLVVLVLGTMWPDDYATLTRRPGHGGLTLASKPGNFSVQPS